MKPLTEYTEAELLQASDEELGDLLGQYLFRYAYKKGDSSIWSSTGNGMLEVLAAMKEIWSVEMINSQHDNNWRCWVSNKKERDTEFYSCHDSLPRAVAVAALLAMKGKS